MAEPTPAPATDSPAAPAERRPSSERKKSTVVGAASTSAERRPSAQAGADASLDTKPDSAAAASEKSPGEGDQHPEAEADGGPTPMPEGTTPPATALAEGSSPATAVDAKLASPSTETPGPEKAEEPINLQWDYSIPLPNCYFRPSLMDLCVPVMANNFAKYPGFGGIPPDERLRVVNEIPLDLPLKLAADMIPQEAYWKRRVQVRWRNCDIVAHGRSWKQTFFERNLQEAMERFDATAEKEKDLIELMKISAPYVHTLDLIQLPSHFDFKLIFCVLQRDLTGLRVNYGIVDTPGAKFDWSKWGMKVSDCRSLSAALTITATLTTLNLSQNRIDADKEDGDTCERLSGESYSGGSGSFLQYSL